MVFRYAICLKGIYKKYAILATDYVFNDLEFVLTGENDKIRFNEGIAHFLEHKMFEQVDGSNAFEKFSRWGASENAFTNFTMTAYLFSTTENFYESLEHLINYVQSPHFTDENVDKEKGIIEQKIKMYNAFNVYLNTLKVLYVNYPVRIDIAGTVDSIHKITKEELYKCYNTFYIPGNMALFVVGDLDFVKIMQSISKVNDKSIISLTNKVEKIYPKEPKKVKEIILNYIDKFKTYGISEEDFNRIKKKKIGNFLKCFDSVGFIANNFLSYKF